MGCRAFSFVSAILLATSCMAEAQTLKSSRNDDIQILVASCSGDKRYNAYTTGRISRALGRIAFSSPSEPLPFDWTPALREKLLRNGHPPRVIALHFSCFERSLSNNLRTKIVMTTLSRSWKHYRMTR